MATMMHIQRGENKNNRARNEFIPGEMYGNGRRVLFYMAISRA